MKLRHAAVLALVGWYLMAPPLRIRPNEGALPYPPLSEWLVVQQFDSREACLKQLTSVENAKVLVGYELCVAADDPRLKGN